jgi:two-component system, NarL family, response regulator NreC
LSRVSVEGKISPFVQAERHWERLKQLRIVIAEDVKLLRDLLRLTLAEIEGVTVVGSAADGEETLRLVREFKPHVLVLDITMPIKNGIEVLKEIRAKDSSTVIVMYTNELDPLTRETCLEAGASYYLDKGQLKELIEICNLELLAG